MTVTKAQSRASNKYAATNYAKISVFVPRDQKQKIVDAAAKSGLSLNAFIIECVNERLIHDGEAPITMKSADAES